MPTAPTYPGVYIEEVPSGVRTISGVATSITAFVGSFSRGPVNEAVRVFSFADFERAFGGLRADSEAAYAIQQFFLNGGGQAYVVRVTNTDTAGAMTTAATAAITLQDGSGNDVMTVLAASPGAWGNALRVAIDYDTLTPTATFNMTVSEVATVGGREQIVASEQFLNLAVDGTLEDVIAGASALVTVDVVQAAIDATPPRRPAPTGTTSDALDLSTLSGTEAADVTPRNTDGSAATGTYSVSVDLDAATTPAALASAFQTALRAVVPDTSTSDDFDLSRATVRVVGTASDEQYLAIETGRGADIDLLAFSGALATSLGLGENVQRYVLGSSSTNGAQALPGGSQQAGADGSLPGAGDLIGSDGPKTGIYALRDVDLFNILCVPATTRLSDTAAAQVATAATGLCEQERAFYLLDVPQPAGNPREQVAEVQAWLDANGSLRHRNAALYYPRPLIADALNGFRLRAVAPSGTVAGLYARIDGARGVWKAPAGTEAVLRGVQRLEYRLTDAENGVLNPLGINCLRTLPVFGRVAWGARTLVGADRAASEWKYVPIRRLALYLEESLYRGLQWVVFEPNDEPLWASIRLNVGAFMQTLFRQGAFQGASARDAYFVKCDRETTTQTDINNGIVNIVVGFAPLKPAEFVILKLQQIAGQIDT